MTVSTTTVPFELYCALRGDFGWPLCPETNRFWDISAARDIVQRTAREASTYCGRRAWRGIDPWHISVLCRHVEPLSVENMRAYRALAFLLAEWATFIDRNGTIGHDEQREISRAAEALMNEAEAFYQAIKRDGDMGPMKGYPVYAH